MLLTEFLLARIAEDEAGARAATPAPWTHRPVHDWRCDGGDMCEHLIYGPPWEPGAEREITPGGGEHGDDGLSHADAEYITRHDPAHVLADCEAKRRIVKGMQPFGELDDINAPEVLGILASVYADHPDYRQEWKP